MQKLKLMVCEVFIFTMLTAIIAGTFWLFYKLGEKLNVFF
jgi:hypothetical protein